MAPPAAARPTTSGQPVRPQAYLERVQENVQANEDGETLCYSIVQEVVQCAQERMLDNYYDRASVPYTVQCVCKEMLDIVQLVFVARDPGETSAAAQQSWVPDEEPEPCPIDTWARGAIPIRRTGPSPTADDIRKGPATPGTQAKQHRPSLSQATRGPVGHLRGKPQGSDTGQTPSDSKTAAKMERSGRRSCVEMQRREAVGDDEGTSGTMRAEQRRRAEIREAAERQQHALREAQGPKGQREVIVDSLTGRVIPVKAVDPQRLPSRRLDMKFAVEAHHHDDDEPGPVRSPVKKILSRTGKVASEFVQPEDTHGPMVEGVMPSGGVMVREGERVARGDRRTSKTRISRSEFLSMLDAAGVQREAFDITQTSQELGGTRRPSQKEPEAPKPDARRKPDSPQGPEHSPQRRGTRRGTLPAVPREAPRQLQGVHSLPLGQANKEPLTHRPQATAPLPPFKPQREELLGQRPQYPRDRGPRTPRSEQRKLPPPLYPATEGHGTVVGQLAADNPYAGTESPQRSVDRATPRIRRHTDAQGNVVAEEFFADLHGQEHQDL